MDLESLKWIVMYNSLFFPNLILIQVISNMRVISLNGHYLGGSHSLRPLFASPQWELQRKIMELWLWKNCQI